MSQALASLASTLIYTKPDNLKRYKRALSQSASFTGPLTILHATAASQQFHTWQDLGTAYPRAEIKVPRWRIDGSSFDLQTASLKDQRIEDHAAGRLGDWYLGDINPMFDISHNDRNIYLSCLLESTHSSFSKELSAWHFSFSCQATSTPLHIFFIYPSLGSYSPPNMVHFLTALGLALSSASLFVSATPVPTTAPDPKNAAVLGKRASCTFTAASAASASKASCATIVLDNIAVPSGVTLDLTDLTSGTHVLFLSYFRSSCL